MCGGASQDQKNINQSQIDFYNNLTKQYGDVFGQQQEILGALTKAFTPILQAGPSQPGFSQAEETALRTQNTENAANYYAQAQRATAQVLAAKGGGNTLLPSSVNANLLAQNANQMEAIRSQGDLGITQSNYDQGYKNWNQAASILGQTAQIYNPLGYAGEATGAGGAAATQANAITAQNNSMWNAAIGALGGAVGNIGSNLLTGGLSSVFKGATGALSGLGGGGGGGTYNGTTGMFNLFPTKGTVPFATGSGYTAGNPLGLPG